MKAGVKRAVAAAALPFTAYVRRKLMELEGYLIRARYFSDRAVPKEPPARARDRA